MLSVVADTTRLRQGGDMWLRAMGVVVAVAAFVVTGAFGVSSSGTITTIAGSGKQGFSGDGGPAVAAQLRSAYEVAVDRQGNVYIADYDNYRVRKVSPGGTITTFAGTGTEGFSGDGGPATSARLNAPIGIAVDGQGNVYIADFNNARVRKVNPGGTITTFAGTGVPGFSGDGGPATSARLYAPHGVAVDGQGNVYIADSYNQRVRKVSPAGTITTIAGTGRPGVSGDGGPATSAKMTYPRGVAADAQGNVYIFDGSTRVRKVSRGGTITTFAGRRASSFGDGGPATSAQLRTPSGVAVDGQGNVYIADFPDHRVRKVSAGGTITTFAGTGAGGFSGDGGPATSARLFAPYGVAVDGRGTSTSPIPELPRAQGWGIGDSDNVCGFLFAESQHLLRNGRPRRARLLRVLPECEDSEEREVEPRWAAEDLSRRQVSGESR